MEFAEVVRRRRMIRSFDATREVPRLQLEKLLNHAIRAPSAGHTQAWRFLVLDDITTTSRFWDAAADRPMDAWATRMRSAPVLIICFSDRQAYLDRYAEPDKGWVDRDPDRWPIPYWDVDTGMAAMSLLLGVVDEGLAACFFGVPSDRWSALAETFHVDPGRRPVGVIAVGHPAADERSRPLTSHGRKPFDDVVTFAADQR